MPREWSFPRVLPQMTSFPSEQPAVSSPVTQSKSQDGPTAPVCTPCLPLRPHLLLPAAASLCPHPCPPWSRAPALDLYTLFLSQPFNFLRGRAQMSPFLDLMLQDVPACLRFSVGPITLWCGLYFTYSLITIFFSPPKMQTPWGQGIIGSFACSSSSRAKNTLDIE